MPKFTAPEITSFFNITKSCEACRSFHTLSTPLAATPAAWSVVMTLAVMDKGSMPSQLDFSVENSEDRLGRHSLGRKS